MEYKFFIKAQIKIHYFCENNTIKKKSQIDYTIFIKAPHKFITFVKIIHESS